MRVTLAQTGHTCELKLNLFEYEAMQELSRALSAGMTPVVSYRADEDMLWIDGEGNDGKGPCKGGSATNCGPQVRFSGFAVEIMPGNECKAELSTQWPVQPRTSLRSEATTKTATTTTGDVPLWLSSVDSSLAIFSEQTASSAGFIVGAFMTIGAMTVLAYLSRKKTATGEDDGTGSSAARGPFIASSGSMLEAFGRGSATLAPYGDDSTDVRSFEIGPAANTHSFINLTAACGADAMGRRRYCF
jgi:hypothetical protein